MFDRLQRHVLLVFLIIDDIIVLQKGDSVIGRWLIEHRYTGREYTSRLGHFNTLLYIMHSPYALARIEAEDGGHLGFRWVRMERVEDVR